MDIHAPLAHYYIPPNGQFNSWRGKEKHKALDLAAGVSHREQPVLSPLDGHVVYRGYDHLGNPGIRILSSDSKLECGLWHCDKWLVFTGAAVKAKQPIAHLADQEGSPYWTGYHVHFILRLKGILGWALVDPERYIIGGEDMTQREADLHAYKTIIQVAFNETPSQDALNVVGARLDQGDNLTDILFHSIARDKKMADFVKRLLVEVGDGGFYYR